MLTVYNFNDFCGIAKTENQDNYELRIYNSSQSNCLLAICSKLDDTFYLYTFISDKTHLSNLIKENINILAPIKEITLYLKKIDENMKKFINYALINKIKINIVTKPF